MSGLRVVLIACLAVIVVVAAQSISQSQNPPKADEYSPELVADLIARAKANGNAKNGAAVFSSPKFACASCHKIGKSGGIIGPDLTKIGICLTPELIVEAILWPKRQVKDEYKAQSVVTTDGKVIQGYKDKSGDDELVLREPATGKLIRLTKRNIDEIREIGTLMPDGLAAGMTASERRDLVRFLMELGRTEGLTDLAVLHGHGAVGFPLERAPLNPKDWPSWQAPVNQYRLYDFYARQAEFFMKQPSVPHLLTEFPGLDGPKFGHWGTQNEQTWADGRWNDSDVGTLMCGVFRGAGVTVPKGVCVRLGERGELAACFNPETLCYEALWKEGFVKFSSVRHGFMDGVLMAGKALARPEGKKPEKQFVYHGFYRHGPRVIFAYTIDGVKMFDAPWAEDGKFTRTVAPAEKHPLTHLIKGGPPKWPQALEKPGTLGSGGPYVVDTIPPPFDNPWKIPLFFGDHDFLPDGSVLLCTMQGDIWRVEGLDDRLDKVRWRRFASGLHQALGLVVSDGKVYVLGRDQITILHDLNGDGEADFHECFCNGYTTSTYGHDYICGLQRDKAGYFYTASSKQGLLRIAPDGKKVDVIATGFRNPDGCGLYPDGAVVLPASEGEWTPASMICLVKPGHRPPPVERIGSPSYKDDASAPPFFGYGGPKNGQPPELPFVYLPRGIDNSSGGQTYVSSERWGPLRGRMIHFSYGQCSHLLVMRDDVNGRPQGGVVPLPGEFRSGAHRGRFSPKDGQLYVSGMGGWGTYGVDDGCFHRVRYTGGPLQLPAGFHVHENGILLTFTEPLDRSRASDVKNYFAQAWNYRYNAAYGSPEFSPSHPGVPGHDHWSIDAAHVLEDGKSVFLEIPQLQPVNQLHLRLHVDVIPRDLFLTIHRLDAPFTTLPNYQRTEKIVAAHPILSDLRAANRAVANPWRTPIKGARTVAIQADKNLTYVQRTITAKPGESIKITFTNPDVVPHNWVLIKPGTLASVGNLANRLIAEPDAFERQYIPKSPDVLAYTDIVPPEGNFSIWLKAPAEKGRYPYLCTFPGHWMVMNGQMIVE